MTSQWLGSGSQTAARLFQDQASEGLHRDGGQVKLYLDLLCSVPSHRATKPITYTVGMWNMATSKSLTYYMAFRTDQETGAQ